MMFEWLFGKHWGDKMMLSKEGVEVKKVLEKAPIKKEIIE